MNEKETKNDQNLMGAVAYFLGFVTGLIIYLIEKDKPDKRRFVMFHAMQSIILSIVIMAISIVLVIIGIIPIIGWIIAIIAGLIYPIIILLLWIFMMYKAYSGEEYHLPVIGDYAEKYI